ncbi:MAG: hypothetical protein IPJ71_15795 [Bdellovibrionales bacterium]|nr:hypothetical protein [Bdellovibrionales bacterium]
MAGLSQQAVVSQIDGILQKYAGIVSRINQSGVYQEIDSNHLAEATSAIHSTIARFSPAGSKHISNADACIKQLGVANSHGTEILFGILGALKAEYASGSLLSIQELIHGDVFSDFLDMAEHLNSEGYKDPAAVLAGGVLEEHLRKLCMKSGVDITKTDGSPKKAEAMNTDLASAGALTKLDQKNVTAWLGLRNDAAHGHYSKYTKDQVALLVSSVRDFITRNPA